MKLFYTPNSPYARTARIALREYGLLTDCEEIVAANRQPDNPVLEFSPVGRVPTLVVGRLVITESRTVFGYLQARTLAGTRVSGAGIDWGAAAKEGQIVGFLDGVAVWIREMRRPLNQRSGLLLQVESDRASRCLCYLNDEVVTGRLPDVSQFAGAALAAALDLMTMHELIRGWRAEHKPLSAWLDEQAHRPSMQQTAPKAALLKA